MANDIMLFDFNKAKELRRSVNETTKAIRKVISSTRGIVEESVDSNWYGASAARFKKLTDNSFTKINNDLNTYIRDIDKYIKVAVDEKEKLEGEETDSVQIGDSVYYGEPKANVASVFPAGMGNAETSDQDEIHDLTKLGFNTSDYNNSTEFSQPVGWVSAEISKVAARTNLRMTAYSQYKWMIPATLTTPGMAVIPSRITDAINAVETNRDVINRVSEQYKIPAEIIGGIIFKEQLTKSLPDFAANIDTFFDGKIIPRSTETHSTGLGAVTPGTARAAWNFIDSSKVDRISDKDLQFKLSYDPEFNIETIAVVLIFEAKNANIISYAGEVGNLTLEQWEKPVTRYNGGSEYAGKVFEYLDDIQTLIK